MSISPQPTHLASLPTGRANNTSSNSSQKLITAAPSPRTSPTIIPTTSVSMTPIHSSTSSFSSLGLITYRNPTLIPSISMRATNNSSSILGTLSPKTTVTSGISKKLPETGAVQYSSILFIVAVTTMFIAFLY